METILSILGLVVLVADILLTVAKTVMMKLQPVSA